MPRIFNQQRMKMLNNHRFTRYLFYATGEIVLVVIGILIALQINNWNQNNKNIHSAVEYLKDLHNDMVLDTLIFGREIKKMDQIIEFKTSGIMIDDFNERPIEELEGMFYGQFHNLVINNVAFSRMKDNHVLTLHEFRELFADINNYYAFHSKYLDHFNEWEVSVVNRELSYWLDQNTYEMPLRLDMQSDTVPNNQDEDERKKSLIELITSIKGRNMIKLSIGREKAMQYTYRRVYLKAKDVLSKIDARLELEKE